MTAAVGTVLRLDLASVGAFALLAATEPLDSGIVTIVVAVIAAIVSLGTAAMTGVVLIRTSKLADQQKVTHDLVNGKMTDLVEGLKAKAIAQIGQASAEGQLAGEQAQRDRSAAPEEKA